jgi:hypothetical protein
MEDWKEVCARKGIEGLGGERWGVWVSLTSARRRVQFEREDQHQPSTSSLGALGRGHVAFAEQNALGNAWADTVLWRNVEAISCP